MCERNKNDEQKPDSIPKEIIESISSIDPELLMKYESSPAFFPESFNIAELLDETKKKEKEKEYKIGNYLIKKTLGQGTFGKVKLGIYLPSQEKVAIKILEKDRIVERDDEIRVKREFDMLALFNHPNVILVAEIFESPDSFFSVMEYCEGGELFNFIVKNRRLSEEEAAFFYYQIINGLEYIHSLGIVHRDLKPENLLLTKDHLLKIIDFGLSNYFKKGQKELLATPCGSPCYASPEMVAGKKYNGFKIDIWSTGIILYAMLCGYLPFEDKDNEVLFEKILECKLEFPSYITKLSKDIIQRILVTDPDKRISIPEIKKHPFFIKGKELFEQEFSICQNEKEDNEQNSYIDLNNILDTPLLKENIDENIDHINKNKKERQKDKNKPDRADKADKADRGDIKIKEIKIDNITDKRRNKGQKINIKNLEQENIIQHINTDYEDNDSNLRNAILIDFDKNENNEKKHRNNSSIKKNINRNNNIKNNSKIINKNNYRPFKKRDIVYLKNKKDNDKNRFLKKDIKINKNINQRNNKKLTKTNKYNNIVKQFTRKKNAGKSVNLRNNNKFKLNKNLIHRKINYTNIIKNKFNSKENFRKNDNIYINNINNTIDEEDLTNKNYLNYDFKLQDISANKHKKTRSVAKKNNKLTSLETIYNQKNKRYLDNLFNINSSIKKYENKLNSIRILNPKNNNKNNIIGLKYNLLGKNNNIDEFNNSINKDNKLKINKEKMKISNIKTNMINNTNPNINIIDNSKDRINNSIENNNRNINYNKIGSKNKISPKNIGYNIKGNKDKYIKKNINVNKLNHVRLLKHNSNIHGNNQENIKINYYLNEIDQKKTIDADINRTYRHQAANTDIFDNSENKKNQQFNLKKMIISDYKNKGINNKTEISDKDNISFMNKKQLMINSNIIKHNSGLNTIENAFRTEPNKALNTQKKIKKINVKNNNIIIHNNDKTDKKQINSKKISTANTNTNNIYPKNKNMKNNKKPNDILTNYTKNLNKTSNNFNFNTINNSSIKNPFNSNNQNNQNILELINTSADYSTNTNTSLNKKISNKKNNQIIPNSNNKKPCVTIKNTVINLNIDTGIILSSSIDKKRKAKQTKSNRGNNNSISQISNNRIYGLEPKYNNILANESLDKINHSSTNENFPIKTKSININDNNYNYNLFSLNDEIDSNNNFEIIKKGSNFQKIYVYDDKNSYKKNVKTNNIKDNKVNNSKINNKSININNNEKNEKSHIKYKSMKLDDYYDIKNKKKDLNMNENSFNIRNKFINIQ